MKPVTLTQSSFANLGQPPDDAGESPTPPPLRSPYPDAVQMTVILKSRKRVKKGGSRNAKKAKIP
ncbi:MAG: hypothetical protein HY868_16740 [Chloroflexi bacterium]|nr:hypothetical protein [Chloroflexota bacterium]